ncbi:MAG TPA: outer membrane beta-barrel domain-containing protein [Polyangiaceae bacterium]|nr:outer membrane beta-barrel domain-containing protein [Polyangiaceae bacterium]
MKGKPEEASMKKSRVGLLVAVALGILPANGWAQEDAGEAAAGEQAADGEVAAEGEGAVDEEAAADESAEGEVVEEGGGLEEICKIDPAACPNLNMEKEAARPLREELYAVQQIFVIKSGRFELNPYWAFTLNDQFVNHPAPGLALNFYISNVLAVGVNGGYYRPFNVDREFNFLVRRAARVAVPLTEYDWSAALNFTYVPAFGKFSGFSDFIFQYDAYVVGGVGAISTRPIPVIDPNNRNPDFEPKLAFNAGIGLRIFFNRWFAVIGEIRDYMFNDKLENLSIVAGSEADPKTWTDRTSFTHNVQAQVGVSIFLPFSFEYRLPK